MAVKIDVDSLARLVNVLLWAFWILCTFAAAVTAIDAPVPQAFKAAVRLSAARGKTWDTKPAALGWLKDVSVPHVWFWHFYLVGVVANVAALALILASTVTSTAQGRPEVAPEAATAAVVSVVLLTHLCRRLAETVLVMRFPVGARMHVLAYVYGLAYYAVLAVTFLPPRLLRAALVLLLSSGSAPVDTSYPYQSAAECGAAGRLDSPSSTEAGQGGCGIPAGGDMGIAAVGEVAGLLTQAGAAALAADRMLLLGVAVIAAGQMLQGHSHLLLASLAAGPTPGTHAADTSDMPAAARSPPLAAESPLRRRGPAAPDVGSANGGPPAPLAEGSGAGQYAVPRGGAFEWVSCPHYLAEIVIYSGFCVAQRFTPLAALVLTWVVVNLVIGAADSHRWYRRTFPEYPPHRRALFPLLW